MGPKYLRNEFKSWNVHGIMNTSGLLQETLSFHDSTNIPKIEFIAYIYILFYITKIWKNILDLGIKTVLYLKYNRINGLVRV